MEAQAKGDYLPHHGESSGHRWSKMFSFPCNSLPRALHYCGLVYPLHLRKHSVGLYI